jgi:hypothetical protein
MPHRSVLERPKLTQNCIPHWEVFAQYGSPQAQKRHAPEDAVIKNI